MTTEIVRLDTVSTHSCQHGKSRRDAIPYRCAVKGNFWRAPRNFTFSRAFSLLLLAPSAFNANANWLDKTDCQAEQLAVRRANVEFWRRQLSDEESQQLEGKIEEILKSPWVYRYNSDGIERSDDDFRKAAQDNRDYVRKVDRNGYAPVAIADLLLRACAFDLAPGKRAEKKQAASRPLQSTIDSSRTKNECAEDQAASINKFIVVIDERIATFLASPAGQQQGSTTPSLQVIMWAALEQSRIIKAQCPESEGFKEMLAARDASFKQAQTVCKQISSSPQVCQPKMPEDVIADYDKANTPVSDVETISVPAKVAVAGDSCPVDEQFADWRACRVAKCRKEGLAAFVADGCVSCGDGDGSKSGRFAWEACHSKSGKSSSAR